MAIPIHLKCVDDKCHDYVLLTTSNAREAGFRKWKVVDTFYCKKCLTYFTAEREVQ